MLAPLRERVVPPRVGLRWPSKLFAGETPARDTLSDGLWPEVERREPHGGLALLHDGAGRLAEVLANDAEIEGGRAPSTL